MTAPNETLNPVEYEAPLVNPTSTGLYAGTTWVSDASADVPRWLASGVRFRQHNYGGGDAVGLWDVPWCGDPGDALKDGDRPEQPDPHDPVVVWSYDECDPTAQSQAEIELRVLQNLRLHEELLVEREFAGRALIDAGTPTTAPNIVEAVGKLEELLGATNTLGYLHASPRWAAYAASQNLLIRNGSKLVTPLGHTWVFGGGYPLVLGDTIVATSPTAGWRTAAAEFKTLEVQRDNIAAAIAERSVLIGYEHAIGAVTVG
ncbi:MULTISPECIES: hypothetical protein [Tsukamurella]|uniref:Gp13 n=2 Tax=Tsukamurella TaxID=2060 RepID=A0A3P8K917_TSUPA|nr:MULTISPECIES: hypothetical protein [Tsukamurella]NKY18169.1 hypothetical protein [Tsukamurella spumae]UEA84024.1 hypothetical protein LK411_04080 [Tsukamurella paurometabola]VDR41184.1 Uncharacterised protein [Tsukamurella paurometabola]